MLRLMVPVVILLTLQGCGKQFSATELNGVRYSFPKERLKALVKDQGQIIVWLTSPDASFKLVYNSRSDRAQRETGKLTISQVNDQFGTFDTIASPAGTVVCNDAKSWNCGFQINDAGARWSVVFDRERIPQAATLRQRALQQLRSYRTIPHGNSNNRS